MSVLPQTLLNRAYLSSNGEMAWAWEDLPEVIESYRSAAVAVLGVEAWLIDGHGRWTGLIPPRKGDIVYVYVVDAPERSDGEDDAAYADRAATEVLRQLGDVPPHGDFRLDVISYIRYCVTPDE